MREIHNKTLKKYLDTNLLYLENRCKEILKSHKPRIVKFYNRYMGLYDAEKDIGHINYTQNENVIYLLNNEYSHLNFEEYDEMVSLKWSLQSTKYIEKRDVLNNKIKLLEHIDKNIYEYEIEFDKFHQALLKLNKRNTTSSFGRFIYSKFESSRIEIYLLSCFIFCKRYKLDIFKFLLTTYAHELAHAFNTLGRDKDGKVWGFDDFCDTNDMLVEGLAQYYAYEYAKDIRIKNDFDKEVELRDSESNKLILGKVYREYKNYQKYSKEQVYGALIYTRRNRITNYRDFRELLEHYKRDLPLY